MLPVGGAGAGVGWGGAWRGGAGRVGRAGGVKHMTLACELLL